jgi:hypothetical protein
LSHSLGIVCIKCIKQRHNEVICPSVRLSYFSVGIFN